MGLFDYLKKKFIGSPDSRGDPAYIFSNAENEVFEPRPNKTDTKEQTIYFKNGRLYRIDGGDQEHWYDAHYLVSDGLLFDLESAESVRSIPSPNYSVFDVNMSGYGVTGNLDYVLRMKAGSAYNRKKKELCSALLWKSTNLMMDNKYCAWSPKDYRRLISWHLELGMIDEAEKAEEYLKSKKLYYTNTAAELSRGTNKLTIEDQLKWGNDLVACHDYNALCCSECAKMNGRVYSISGTHSTFPPLPDYAKKHGNFHPGCKCSISVYFLGSIYYRGEQVDPVTASLRPFVDDRTPEQKQKYEDYVNRIAAEQEYEEQKLADKKVYAILQKELPDEVPKSFGAYRRMKNSNSQGFQKLQKKASEIGISI